MFPFQNLKYTFMLKLSEYVSSISKIKDSDYCFQIAVEVTKNKTSFGKDLTCAFLPKKQTKKYWER